MKQNLSWKEVAMKWSDGELVWSADLGGMGPGYEQTIQILLMEIMVRWPEDKDVPAPDDGKFPNEFNDHVDAVVKDLNPTLSFSGAQVGAAKSTAYNFMHFGYAEMMAKLGEDRKIMVSMNFPRVPDPGVGTTGTQVQN